MFHYVTRESAKHFLLMSDLPDEKAETILDELEFFCHHVNYLYKISALSKVMVLK